MKQPTTIYFVRHGEVHNPHCLYYGRLPGFQLSSAGVLQAQTAASLLEKHELTALYSSPLERAVGTAQIIGARCGLDLHISELLLEVFSPFDGQPMSILAERNWDVYTGVNPPYEQPADLLKRARRFIWQIRENFPGQKVAAVSHGDLIAALVLWARQRPFTPPEKQALYTSCLTYAAIFAFTYATAVETEIPNLTVLQP